MRVFHVDKWLAEQYRRMITADAAYLCQPSYLYNRERLVSNLSWLVVNK